MKAFVLVAVAFGLVLTGLTGCSQSSNTASQSPTAQSNAATQVTATPNYGGVLGQARTYSIGQIDLAQVKQAIQEFNAAEGHYPKDLQQLIPNYLAKIPNTPAGYQISYDPVNGTVKVVRQQ